MLLCYFTQNNTEKEFVTIKHMLFSCKRHSIKVCCVDKPDRFGVLGT